MLLNTGVKDPVTFVYHNAEESQYLFSAYPVPGLALLTVLPGINAQRLQYFFLPYKLPNGWFQRSKTIIGFLKDLIEFLLEQHEENPPVAFMAELDNLLLEQGITR